MAAAESSDSTELAARHAETVSEETDSAGSVARSGRQAAWNYLVFGLSKSSTLIMTVVVARVLTPAEFGFFALALLVVNLFDYIKDMGVGAALVQSPSDWRRLAPTGLTLSILFGVVAGAVLALTAPLSAAVLGNPELTPLIRVLAIALVLNALSTVPSALLRRNLDFRRRLIPEVSGAIVKTVLTIGLALSGYGVWSLVYGQLAAVTVMCVGYWWVAKPMTTTCGFDRREAAALVRFGLPATAATLVAYAIYNVDYLAIGSRLGETELGLYTLAYRIPELVVLNLCVVISDVLFSALSRMQHDRPALAEHYGQVLTMVVTLTAPISITLAVAAPAVVEVLYGDKYGGVAAPLAVISLYTLLYSASFHSGDVLKAIGRPTVLTVINVAKLAVMVGPVWWAAGHSLMMVAWVLVAVEFVHFCIRIAIVRALADVPVGLVLGAVVKPMPATVVAAAAMFGAMKVISVWPAVAVVLVVSLVGLTTYIAVLRLTAPDVIALVRTIVRSRAGEREG